MSTFYQHPCGHTNLILLTAMFQKSTELLLFEDPLSGSKKNDMYYLSKTFRSTKL